MDIYSFNKIQRDENQNNLYDLFPVYVSINSDIPLYKDIVLKEEHMRADLICRRLYNTDKYLEEFLKVNNLFNKWSIYEGDEFFYFSLDDGQKLHYTEPVDNTDKINKLVNSTKNTKVDENRKLPPTINDGKKQIIVNKNNYNIKIIDDLS